MSCFPFFMELEGKSILIAGEGHIPQVARGNIVVDPAVGDERSGLDLVVQTVRIRLFLHVHHDQRGDDDQDRRQNRSAKSHYQALLDGHVLEIHM